MMDDLGGMDRLVQYLDIMACPKCKHALSLGPESLECCFCSRHYPVRDGRPVFLADANAVKVMSPEHLSNQPPGDVLDWLRRLDGRALNIGAGGTATHLPNCLELEYAIFRHTDVVADAHELPFRDQAFDAVVTFNTFEHLYDPERAANEVHRVLKPGGKVILNTAFLQPLHEAPHHYYNATEFGVRRWFREFQIDDLRVSANFQPAHVLAWIASEILRAAEQELGRKGSALLEKSSLRFWRDAWENGKLRTDSRWHLLQELSADTQKRFAAGFHLVATKGAA
jgi:SAM-dependent methyltransferase